jgi:polyhydroxyalkanoate synthase
MRAVDVQTGRTPRREIYRRNKSRVYRYASMPKYRTPVLFVPNLGISRPYIFDLMPGSSFFEYMGQVGFDCYLLDWGIFGPEDNRLRFEDAADGILRYAWDAVLDAAGAEELSVIGYCMGASMALSLVAARPDLGVRAFVSLAGLVDFSEAGLFQRWLDPRWFGLDRLVERGAPSPARHSGSGAAC